MMSNIYEFVQQPQLETDLGTPFLNLHHLYLHVVQVQIEEIMISVLFMLKR